ncbi:hypothetical protein KR067_009784 [Drosophila pandora]|nr:hypothetical protein KR067_009784 [Drosophila pandora]
MDAKKELKKAIEYFENVTITQVHLRADKSPCNVPLNPSEEIPSMEKLYAVQPRLQEAGKRLNWLGLPEKALDMDISSAEPGEEQEEETEDSTAGGFNVLKCKDLDRKDPWLMFFTGVETDLDYQGAERSSPMVGWHMSGGFFLNMQVISRSSFARRAAQILRRAYEEMYQEGLEEKDAKNLPSKEAAPPAL